VRENDGRRHYPAACHDRGVDAGLGSVRNDAAKAPLSGINERAVAHHVTVPRRRFLTAEQARAR